MFKLKDRGKRKKNVLWTLPIFILFLGILIPNIISANTNVVDLGEIQSSDYGLDIAKGNVPGTSIVHKFGRNPAVTSSTDPETVWLVSTKYVYQTAAQTLNVSSSSGNDDGTPTSNSGAQTILIQGLDENFTLIDETITLEGTAHVQTTKKFIRVFRSYVKTSGTYHGANEGTVTALFNTSGDTAFGYLAGAGQTELAFYTIPAGKTGYLQSYDISIDGTKEVDLELVRYENADDLSQPYTAAERRVIYLTGVSGTNHKYFDTPIKFNEKTDIEWVIPVASASSTAVSINFDLILVDN